MHNSACGGFHHDRILQEDKARYAMRMFDNDDHCEVEGVLCMVKR